MPTAAEKPIYILEPTNSSLSPSDNASVTLSNEYGKSDTCQDLYKLLVSMGYSNVQILPISLDNLKQVITPKLQDGIVFNLCDGCETDGYPGISVIQAMDSCNLKYTGSDRQFYEITTSKPDLKRVLMAKQVPTSPFLELTNTTTEAEVDALFKDQYPLIVKPAISYASIAISDKSVVHSAKDALQHAKNIERLANLGTVDNQVFVERFLAGREYTVLVTGSERQGTKVYEVAERVFNPKLQTYERILAFDKYWQGYDLEGNTPAEQSQVYWYQLAPADVQQVIKQVARDAYVALGGSGYGRVDIRTSTMDKLDPQVLEVNSNCGISFNPNEFTSTVGEILKMSGVSVQEFAKDLLNFAQNR